MKLVFPNGEHSQVLLSPGVNRIGSDPDSAAVLTQDGILPHHCEIHITSTGANLQVGVEGGPVTVNGKPVTDIMSLRAGDSIGIGPVVVAKYAIVEAARSAPSAGSPDEDSGATRVRMAVPKYVLRGVSGAVFSKVFPVTGPVVIGRAAECDISVPADEISRRHAMVKPTAEGLSVEDLGSSNGTYINNKRVQHGFLNPGDELRLDAVRFILVAPGMEMAARSPQAGRQAAATVVGRTSNTNKMQTWAMIMLAVAALLMIGLMIVKH
ncbi:MAG TPA: FHA domain-containing protein [Arenimonas sp.]|uniref:FHA domain-containing protein n=1 Tax=Arenimonas sp. TaxID=1872635 RepID=UPI002C42E8D7|nr:FHA domain-containing protein [Arenimonas sp.]HMB57220.1 FHA domain-containing protein [Arenimonas sp.]